MLRKLSCLVVSDNFLRPCRKVCSSGSMCLLSAARWWTHCRIVAVWGLYDAVLARTASLGSGKKRAIPCDPLFYSQPHVTSRKGVIGHFSPSHVCPL